MKTFIQKSPFLRACCTAFLAFAFLLGAQSLAHGQTKAEIKAEFQSALSQLPSVTATSQLTVAQQQVINDIRTLCQQGVGIENLSAAQEAKLYQDLDAKRKVCEKISPSKQCLKACFNDWVCCVAQRCKVYPAPPSRCRLRCDFQYFYCVINCWL